MAPARVMTEITMHMSSTCVALNLMESALPGNAGRGMRPRHQQRPHAPPRHAAAHPRTENHANDAVEVLEEGLDVGHHLVARTHPASVGEAEEEILKRQQAERRDEHEHRGQQEEANRVQCTKEHGYGLAVWNSAARPLPRGVLAFPPSLPCSARGQGAAVGPPMSCPFAAISRRRELEGRRSAPAPARYPALSAGQARPASLCSHLACRPPRGLARSPPPRCGTVAGQHTHIPQYAPPARRMQPRLAQTSTWRLWRTPVAQAGPSVASALGDRLTQRVSPLGQAWPRNHAVSRLNHAELNGQAPTQGGLGAVSAAERHGAGGAPGPERTVAGGPRPRHQAQQPRCAGSGPAYRGRKPCSSHAALTDRGRQMRSRRFGCWPCLTPWLQSRPTEGENHAANARDWDFGRPDALPRCRDTRRARQNDCLGRRGRLRRVQACGGHRNVAPPCV